MSRFIFNLIILPLSRLPLWILYGLSNLLYALFLSVWPYRKRVIIENLKHSFPEKSEQEIRKIQRKYYRHLADLLAEGIKNLSIKKDELLSRIVVENIEIMEQLMSDKRNILLVGGHYGNWEWLITAQALLFKQHAIGLGKPLSNSTFDQKINSLRGRFGMDIVHAGNYKSYIEKKYKNGFAMLTLSDQSPGDSSKSFWTKFLNQQTAVLYGAEQIARKYDLSIVFFELNKTKRGYYNLNLNLICENPKTMGYGQITELHTKLLEQQILNKPEYWLWSHKRWKREVPTNLVELMAEHRNNFENQQQKTSH